MANGQKKASIVQKALTSPATEVPASVIQIIPHALVLLDEEAGELLGLC